MQSEDVFGTRVVERAVFDHERGATFFAFGRTFFGGLAYLFLIFMATNYLFRSTLSREPASVTVPYTFFKQQAQAGNVETVTSLGDAIQGTFRAEVTYPPSEAVVASGKAPASPPADKRQPTTSKHFKTQRPAFADPGLEALLEEKGVSIQAVDEKASSWVNLLLSFGPTILLIAAFVWLGRRAAAQGGGVFGLGKSPAKRYSDAQRAAHSASSGAFNATPGRRMPLGRPLALWS